MKILFLDQTGKLGGAELSLIDVVQAFHKSSSVILFQDGPFRSRLEDLGISVEVFKSSGLGSRKESGLLAGLRSIIAAFPLIKHVAVTAKDYDYIYANTQRAFVIGALASCLSGRPLVYHLRDILSRQHFSKLNLYVISILARRVAKVVITNSKATQQSFLDLGGQPEKVHVVYNGFDPNIYRSDSDQRDHLRTHLSVSDKFVIGHFSRLSPWKGQHILLQALQKCPDSAVVLFVGDALFGEDDYVQELHQQVETLGLSDRVHFLGFRSDIPELMNACDVIAHTSTAPEAFGRVIVEGMLCGIPVIASADGGAAELVQSGRTGWSIEPGNVEVLAAALVECMENSDLRDSIVSNAKSYALDNFQVDRLQREIPELLMRL